MVTEENEKFFDIFSNAIIKIENTKTGDNIGVYLVTSLIAVIGLLTIYRKKQIN